MASIKSIPRPHWSTRLENARIDAGFKAAADFATYMGLSQQRYAHYEAGLREPKYQLLIEICTALNVTPTLILSGAKRSWLSDPPAAQSDPADRGRADLLNGDPIHKDRKPVAKTSKPRHFVRKWRKYRLLTMEQLAERVGVTHGAIGQLERGEVNYTQPMLEAIADALACHPGDLVSHDPIQKDKQPTRPHHIADWAELRRMSQADLAEALGADKSVISRWFSGSTPSTKWQQALADVLRCGAPEALFRHPNDDWLSQFLRGRTQPEVERIKATLETAFPRKAG